MRTSILLILALLVPAASNHAQATTQQGYTLLAQARTRLPASCGEQANALYLQYTSLKCNTSNPPRPGQCEPLMARICALAEKCERAGAYCTK